MKLGIIELHHKDLHGSDEDSTPNIATHFMVYNAFGYPGGVSVFEKLNKEYTTLFEEQYKTLRRRSSISHPTVRNYKKYINNASSFEIKIFRMKMLSGGEYVAFPIGTFWLKILQRTWKNKYKLIVKRRKFEYLKKREIIGR